MQRSSTSRAPTAWLNETHRPLPPLGHEIRVLNTTYGRRLEKLRFSLASLQPNKERRVWLLDCLRLSRLLPNKVQQHILALSCNTDCTLPILASEYLVSRFLRTPLLPYSSTTLRSPSSMGDDTRTTITLPLRGELPNILLLFPLLTSYRSCARASRRSFEFGA